MSAVDRLEDGFPHGTVAGFDSGCRGGYCPGEDEHGLSCRRAKHLAAGDWRYNRLVAQGLTPAEIAAELGETPHEHPAPLRIVTDDDEDVQVDDLDEEPIEGEDPIMNTTTAPSPATIIKSRKPEPQDVPEWPDETEVQGDAKPDENLVVDKSVQDVPSEGVSPAAIRAWARENNVPVNARGKVATSVVEAYNLARGHITVEVPAEATDEAPALKPEFGAVSCAVTPFIGARAWVRFDDGVAVVRDVSDSGDQVRVSWLPDPRDEEAWFTYLDSVTSWLPASDFSFDEFPGGSLTPGEVESVGMPAPVDATVSPFEPEVAADLNAEADGEPDLPEAPTVADVVETLQHVTFHGPVADAETRAQLFNEGWDEARRQSVEVTIEALAESLEFALMQWAAAMDRAQDAEARADAAERELAARRPWWKRIAS